MYRQREGKETALIKAQNITKDYQTEDVVVHALQDVDFENNDKLNIAGRFYLLLYDMDIDLMFLTGGSRSDRYGFDFSRNITTNFEIHGEFAYFRSIQKNVLDSKGYRYSIEGDAISYVVGFRHLTSFDLTTIIEYYHNGTGFSVDEMENYYAYITRGYDTYQTTGNATILGNAPQMAEGGMAVPTLWKTICMFVSVRKSPSISSILRRHSSG
jgi:hypothetical protein